MTAPDPYQIAYERERHARLKAETLLDEKTRALYDNVIELEKTVGALKATQEKLIQSEKMASIGQLAAGVAHEINNPVGFSLSNITTLTEYFESLATLDGFVQTHLAAFGEQARVADYQQLRQQQDVDFIYEDAEPLLSDTVKGLHRVRDIVANLKKVSHQGELTREACDINQCIDDSIKVVWNELRYSMEIERDFATLPAVHCQSSEIHQVLMNMFLNAGHACGEQGRLRIKTHCKRESQQDWVVIDIADDGRGMPKSVLNKIFDPFFTTKPVGVGTGLGLSISFGIIEKHQGKIEVVSKEGQGTCFSIYLPLSADSSPD